jgi:hypothetical protein
MIRLAALSVLLLGGCNYYFEEGDDDAPAGDVDAGWSPTSDGGPASSDAQEEVECDALSLLPNGFVAVESVSTGNVSNTAEGDDEFTTEVDASAGGADGQATTPFIYLDLLADDGAARVDIDDVTSFASTDWDLALKRYVIRANGGDSGPGDDAVATRPGAELTFSNDVPQLFADDWASPTCELVMDDVGGPRTRFSNWYDVMNGRFLARDVLHVVRLRDGTHAEIDIETYYADGANPNRGGIYRLHWRRF